ncbi:heterogeneous nuclear ribonucleoprotein L-like [Acipenser ruthenus]|uniref:heterogeneous nuclear ribonucleoprotein L-like n=1 Tax=Acipenser ruthenus TaxID=7906 RepID=UPI002741CB97|nr:heterogeneous nuclear ribonucleoprotein L-like [Acipenser ruthenus]
MESEENSRTTLSKDSAEGHRRADPSPVVHVRGLLDSITEEELVEALQGFGAVSNVRLLPRNQALVEFESLSAAEDCVESEVTISGQLVFLSFSTSSQINERAESGREPNHVLLFTVLNPLYPVTTDMLYLICCPYGEVLRIVIFRRNGLQAMVEFDCVETAQAVRAVLQGAELFSGCCSLRIEFAKPSKLSVLKNDSETRDYTVPPFYKAEAQTRPALLGHHPSAFHAAVYGRPGHYSAPRPLLESMRDPESLEAGIPSLLSLPMPHRPPSHGPPPPPALGRVLMLHGLEPSQFNCERVFNLLCVFGNVELVKFLRNKPGVAMVQMGDEYAVERAVMHLNNSVIFDSKIGACVSKQPEIIPGRSFELDDGSSSYKDFYMSKNNRFTSQEKTAKNRFQHPSRTLHFFSAPPEVTADNFEEVCDSLKLPSFCSCKIFPPKNKSSSGLIEWDSIPKAMEALVVLNHHLMRQADQKVPYTLRLCFSNAGDRE